MPSRRALAWGAACVVLALACTPAGTALDLELPEVAAVPDDMESRGEAEPDPSEEPEPIAALPTARCRPGGGPTASVEVTDGDDPRGGRLLTELADGRVLALPLRHTRFESIVVGAVAETTVTQRFANDQAEPIEVLYTFPLPHDGAVDEYWLQVGRRRIEGSLHRRREAEQIYEFAKKEGKTAGLLTQERPNVFTQHVANVAPGESIEVSVHVVQRLRPERGRYQLALPTVVGPRYIPGTPIGTESGAGMVPDTDVVPDASRITPPILPPGFRSCGDLEIEVSIDAGAPITEVATKSHRIEIEPDHLGAMVSLDEDYALLDRDFVLSWRHEGDEPTATVQAQPDPDGQGGWFTLTIQPPTTIDPTLVPARELVFVVDASGSMSGQPMDVAKATMRRFIRGLGPDDAFQVIRFSESASALGTELLPNTPRTVSDALAYVDELAGQGGTEMTEGVRAALGMRRRHDRMRHVVFLTDGYIGNEAEVFELVAERIGTSRLFSLGVGSSVNRYLLDGMARMGRGAVTYVDPAEPTGPVVDRIYDKLRQPALVDLAVDVEGLDVSDLVPATIPDLFVGEPVVLFGRYEGELRGAVTVRGRRGDELVEIPVALQTVRDEDSDGVRSMWAREQIDELLLDPSLAWAGQARREATEQEVIELSLAHRVLTQFTAFVAVDRTRVVQGQSRGKTVVQGVDIPGGVAYEAVWGQVGQPPGGEDDEDVGGLGLSGTGRGGGGTGEGTIGLGNTGLIGKGGGAGGGDDYTVPPGGVALGSRNAASRAAVQGALPRELVRRVVRSHHSEVRRCYLRGLSADPTLAGRVVIRFVIDEQGRVADASVHESGLLDEEVAQCIAEAAQHWTFPKARDGGRVKVTYPFVLSPQMGQ